MSKKQSLDQYYTKPDIAYHCVKVFKSIINKENRRAVVEPSAGNGAFLGNFKNTFAFDLDPKVAGIFKKDFFKVGIKDINDRARRKVSVLGNPPFGFAGSLAIKFFNHSADLANTIGFIVPKSFKKISIQSKLNPEYHLMHSEDLPENSFILNGESYSVPCCFQIWQRKPSKFKRVKKIYATDKFRFINKSKATKNCFCVRRVGGKSGQVLTGLDHSESSTYWIRPIQPGIKKTISNIDFSEIVNNTAGVRSISKQEIIMGVEK